MKVTKVLWGQVCVVLLIVLGAIWAATQWTAHALAYQPELGRPWFWIWHYPVYPPPAFFWRWFGFDAYAPHIFSTGGKIAASGGILSVIVAVGMSIWRARETKKAETFGSARWATSGEIKRAGLLGEDGVPCQRQGARDHIGGRLVVQTGHPRPASPMGPGPRP